jgi:methionine-rich copper-binding protein CopC
MNITRPILTSLLSIAAMTAAEAHAFLDHALPRVGSSVVAPAQVEVWMTEELEPAFSKLQVFDAKGAEVDLKGATISGATMTVALPELAPGVYKVVWSAVAVDTHHTTGTFNFTVQ